MANRATITVQDRETSPVTHDFTPDGEDANGVHVFSEKTGVPASDARFTASLRKSGGKVKPTLKLMLPVVQTQTINGISNPVVVRTAYVELTASFDSLSTAQERANAIGLMADALAADQTMLNDLLVNASDIY